MIEDNSLMKTLAIFFTVLALPQLLLAAGIPQPVIRYSVTAERTRIVLDLPETVVYSDISTPRQPAVKLAMPLASPLPPVEVKDDIVSEVLLKPDADQLSAQLSINLTQPRHCTIFALPATPGKPFRLVVDVRKRFHSEEQQRLSPAIKLTRVEEQTDDRYLVAHILEVNTTDPHVHLRVVQAQPPRERVAEMVTRTGAVCGVNGGFFEDATHPLQLLKVDRSVLLLPVDKRCAVAFPAKGTPVIGNPDGFWRVTLPDGTVRDIVDVYHADAPGPAPTVVADSRVLAEAWPGPGGAVALIRDNKVLSCTTSMVKLAPGDRAICLCGADRDTLGKLLVEGGEVQMCPVLMPRWTEFPSAVSAGPRLLRAGHIDIPCDAERVMPDIRNGRNSRTALGVTRAGRTVLIVVEAPGPYGGGATLQELAGLLQARGAVEGLNLDGGGSSNLAVGNVTVNYPPHTWLRPVADGVLAFDDRFVPSAPANSGEVSPPSREIPATRDK